MNVAVLGLWHLGSVTAVCMAAAGHQVTVWDPDRDVLDRFAHGLPPVAEPGLADSIQIQLQAGRLVVAPERDQAVTDADIVWVTFDTPVDDADCGDVDYVVDQVAAAFGELRRDAIVLISSQLPVGTTRRLEARFAGARPDGRVSFAFAPENLRLGRAIEAFMNPDRLVVGVRTQADRDRLAALYAPIPARIEWMSVESAEMTKHALNAFLATSIAFINEIAALSERVGADARDVERGLKSEHRIGSHAYLTPGAAFAGGTLARDLTFLRSLGAKAGCSMPILNGVQASNLEHRGWTRRRLEAELGSLAAQRVAVWGLTYKPGTDTLRRSESIELCRWLVAQGAVVAVHDSAVEALPDDLVGKVTRHVEPLEAAQSADALVVATEWPVYQRIKPDQLAAAMPRGLVIDANRFLGPTLGSDARLRIVSVGAPRWRHGLSTVAGTE